jgi:hypothetical protein
MRAVWDIVPCSFGVDRCFITLIMEAVHISETSVYSETTRRYIPDGSYLHTRRRENLISHTIILQFPSC